MKEQNDVRHYCCYATANDRRFYLQDIKNIVNLCAHSHGVDRLQMLIAVSKVKNYNIFDRIFVKTITSLVNECKQMQLMGIFYKENAGRDFSSYGLMSRKIQQIGNDEDYVFFRNRSAYGPFCNDWYRLYKDHFHQHEKVALVGETINFKDHPDRSGRDDLPHIQTYTFLTRVKLLKMLGQSFPGETETERLNIIVKGEIGLSQNFLNRGYYITCLEWPGKLIDNNCRPLTKFDGKDKVEREHPFYHRRYIKKNGKGKDPLAGPLFLYLSHLLKGRQAALEGTEIDQ